MIGPLCPLLCDDGRSNATVACSGFRIHLCLVRHMPDEPVVCRDFAMLSGRVVIVVFTGAITFLQVMLNALGCQLTY